MQLNHVDNKNIFDLYKHWISIGKSVPYYFPVQYESFKDCLFKDKRDNEVIFKDTEEYIAIDHGKILGFIQYGQPNFHFNSCGDKYSNPQIGIIRNLYYTKGRQDVGEVLIQKAEEYFKKNEFKESYAFYHAMGISCNAGHGKLFESMIYIEKLLKEHNFQVEHENVYYRKELSSYKDKKFTEGIELTSYEIRNDSKQLFNIIQNKKEVGKVEMTYIKEAETAYLNWIAIKEKYRNKGIGTIAIEALLRDLSNKGIKQLDTDTARLNIVAQKFYEKNGFHNLGFSRSYIRKVN